MFSGAYPANDISLELVIGRSRRFRFRHSRRLTRSKSPPAQAEVAVSHGKDSDARPHLNSHATHDKNSGFRELRRN
jgi:hypothetical protein